MIPFPAEEVLPMLAMMFLRFGAPVMLVVMLGSLVQRFEQRRA
jgi:hypothetical protein